MIGPSWLQLSEHREAAHARIGAPTTPEPGQALGSGKMSAVAARGFSGAVSVPGHSLRIESANIWEAKWKEKRQKGEGIAQCPWDPNEKQSVGGLIKKKSR